MIEIRHREFANGVVYALQTKDGYPVEVTDTFLPYYTKDAIGKHQNKLNNYECVGTLEPSDYEKLCSLHEKALVDYQIERIKAHHYIGYMNFDRIDHMCKEYETRKSVSPPKKKNSFHNFHERDYPPGYWEELERKLLAN